MMVMAGILWGASPSEKRTAAASASVPTFRMPLDRIRITSRFTHRRWHPILHKYRPHHGVDFGAKRGTPIRAIASGRVIYAGWMRGYGKTIKIDHGHGFVSLYGHQSALKVKRGQRVRRGQIIGRVGNTGRSTGPHLHLGLYRRGKPVDPLKYIRTRRARSALHAAPKAAKKRTVSRKKKEVTHG
jgi:murein DD-endopeptidase MepM/ murein hydrolase activator NlpD